ncbi:MAG: hypothetical protein EU550_01860 [Promethearchaeota archaeon]|nr:MAG: hypothetical protein EU550_01860 [Candidatus Lokiarchaeota archaeon]
MVLSPNEEGKVGEIKRNVRNYHVCPYCNKKFEIGVENFTLKELSEKDCYPYPHLHLHGNPLHAMLCYIDRDLTIRSVGFIKSIEISRDYATFKQLMKKWSNPY